MKKNSPQVEYLAPEVKVFEIKSQGVLCQSNEVPDMQEGWDLVY